MKQRKSFLPSLIIAVLLWIGLGLIVYFVNPYSFGAMPMLLITIFLATLFTFALIFANTRRGVLVSLIVTIFLILRYFGIGNVLNFILLSGLGITIELFFLKTQS